MFGRKIKHRTQSNMAAVNRKYLLKKLTLLLILRVKLCTRENKYKKRFWIRKIYHEQLQKGEYHLLVTDMRLSDHKYFFRCFRMTLSLFEGLLSWIGLKIKKTATPMRDPIGPSERLAVTLRYLVTGDAQVTIAASYRISPSTIGRIIKETCKVLWDVLEAKGFLNVPQTEEQWKKISHDFNNYWNFPHALGAIDGKHIVIQAPPRAGSEFFNYKKNSQHRVDGSV